MFSLGGPTLKKKLFLQIRYSLLVCLLVLLKYSYIYFTINVYPNQSKYSLLNGTKTNIFCAFLLRVFVLNLIWKYLTQRCHSSDGKAGDWKLFYKGS